jgi:hypothetical protein HMPREF0733_11968
VVQDTRPEGHKRNITPLPVSQDRSMATFAHFSGIIGFLPAAAIYYLYRDRAPFTEQESREAMNFTLLPSIMILVLLILSFVPGMASLMMFFTAILWLYMAISSVIAGIYAAQGEPHRYKLNLRILDLFLKPAEDFKEKKKQHREEMEGQQQQQAAERRV